MNFAFYGRCRRSMASTGQTPRQSPHPVQASSMIVGAARRLATCVKRIASTSQSSSHVRQETPWFARQRRLIRAMASGDGDTGRPCQRPLRNCPRVNLAISVVPGCLRPVSSRPHAHGRGGTPFPRPDSPGPLIQILNIADPCSSEILTRSCRCPLNRSPVPSI